MFDISEFIIVATLETELTTVTAESFYEVDTESHFLDLFYCGAITDEEGTIPRSATLSFTYDGKHAENSPWSVTMIPGPFNIARSSLVEWSPAETGCTI